MPAEITERWPGISYTDRYGCFARVEGAKGCWRKGFYYKRWGGVLEAHQVATEQMMAQRRLLLDPERGKKCVVAPGVQLIRWYQRYHRGTGADRKVYEAGRWMYRYQVGQGDAKRQIYIGCESTWSEARALAGLREAMAYASDLKLLAQAQQESEDDKEGQ